MAKQVLITGGLGYIGSHVAVALAREGCEVVLLDNLSHALPGTQEAIAELIGYTPATYIADVCDLQQLSDVFSKHAFTAVIHLAGLKSIPDSLQHPLRYVENNVTGTVNVLHAMQQHGVNDFIFSSSATVYGHPSRLPIDEEAITNPPINPYGTSKAVVEQILQSTAAANSMLKISILRYFNPIGADSSGKLAEFNPGATTTSLMPALIQAADDEAKPLTIFGDNYDTIDGSCIRDFIHVSDLADAHSKAYHFLTEAKQGCYIHNIGTGHGTSVMQLVNMFHEVTGLKVAHHIGAPRAGDIPAIYTSCAKANRELQWHASRDLSTMLSDAWHSYQQAEHRRNQAAVALETVQKSAQ